MEETLLLNASYEPLAIIPWKAAIRLIFLDKAEALKSGGKILRSAKVTIPLPSVVRLTAQVRYRRPRVKFSRANILRRDDYICQYCAKRCTPERVTLDHILPLSRGGTSSWENLVACCHRCNHQKDNMTPEEAGMPLLRQPIKPKWMDSFMKESNEAWVSYIRGWE